jgi:hypothetical protein
MNTSGTSKVSQSRDKSKGVKSHESAGSSWETDPSEVMAEAWEMEEPSLL